jgi:spore coat polysaccharide biosynthesis protein SpsF
MTGVVLQARLGSTRLPRKALLPFGDGTLLESCLRRLTRVPAELHILATEPGSAPELGPRARALGWKVFVGSEEDVLSRYCGAIREYGLSRVVRATADNPFVSPEAAKALLADPRTEASEYAAHEGLPLGFGVEVVRASALLAAESESSDPYEREHVCPFLYRRPERFRIYRPKAPESLRAPEARVTVDTREDYQSVLDLAAECGFDPPSADLALRLLGRGGKD